MCSAIERGVEIFKDNSVGYLRSAWVKELHACVRFNIYALRLAF